MINIININYTPIRILLIISSIRGNNCYHVKYTKNRHIEEINVVPSSK